MSIKDRADTMPDAAPITRARARLDAVAGRFGGAAKDLRSWLDEPDRLRRMSRWLLPALVLAGLLLPPVALPTRLRTLGYAKLGPGQDARIDADVDGSWLEVRRKAVLRPTRIGLRSRDSAPRDAGPIPGQPRTVSRYFELDIRGPAPSEAWLSTALDMQPGTEAFIDPFGWDGERWQWLPLEFSSERRARAYLPLDRFVPRYVVFTEAPADTTTQVAAVLLPPPAAVPAAVARLPILELRAYSLRSDDGRVTGQRFRIPSRGARVYGVVDNIEGPRLRDDLVDNILLRQASRERHRAELLSIVRRDGLDGLVLDYRDLAPDLIGVYTDWLGRLEQDLEAAGAELYVTVPMPRRTNAGWDASPYDWRELGRRTDGLRVRLPNDAPLEIEALDAMVRWALGSVERRKLQLAVPVQGRDVVDGQVTGIGYGDALARVLDMAASDLPDRVTPGSTSRVELPTIQAAELGRDPATGMWRFYWWDANRRQHTVWLNDAEGLAPAFDIASTYRLSHLALDGVEAGLDPALWEMVTAFIETGAPRTREVRYGLRWSLINEAGQVVQESEQSLDQSAFSFRAPRAEGLFTLGVNLVDIAQAGRVAAVGRASGVRVAPPPPPSPTATPNIIIVQPTERAYATAPPPSDELRITRSPVRIDITPVATVTETADATVVFASAQLRDGPSTRDAKVIGDLRVGERLSVQGRSIDNAWLQVVVIATGVQGWVLLDLVDLELALERIPYAGDGAALLLTPGLALVSATPPAATPRAARPGPTPSARSQGSR